MALHLGLCSHTDSQTVTPAHLSFSVTRKKTDEKGLISAVRMQIYNKTCRSLAMLPRKLGCDSTQIYISRVSQLSTPCDIQKMQSTHFNLCRADAGGLGAWGLSCPKRFGPSSLVCHRWFWVMTAWYKSVWHLSAAHQQLFQSIIRSYLSQSYAHISSFFCPRDTSCSVVAIYTFWQCFSMRTPVPSPPLPSPLFPNDAWPTLQRCCQNYCLTSHYKRQDATAT